MEQRIREYAHVSVMRGCGFGMLAIVTSMMGVANEPALALKFGGLGMLLMAFVLILKAARVDQTRFRSTEVWIMLDEGERPPEALAPFLIAEARKDALLRYAYLSAIIAVVMLAGELVFLILT
jgi:hypothetical protein